MREKKHIKEFSKRALSYDKHTKIQKNVAKNLIDFIKKSQKEYKRVLDLGSGTGAIYKELEKDIELFVGVDASEAMCQIHPKGDKATIINEDFESNCLYEKVESFLPFDLILSSSSLQWASRIEGVFEFCKRLDCDIGFAIFCDGTFDTIYKMSKKKSFLPNSDELVLKLKNFWNIDFFIEKREVYFEDNISIFRYIKKSGVSGGDASLKYKEIKSLIQNYPHNYLEFEILYVRSI